MKKKISLTIIFIIVHFPVSVIDTFQSYFYQVYSYFMIPQFKKIKKNKKFLETES